ncbi:unnamed protein product [Acanthoscelides obtectus]|uniref:Uncharacterized protein n=1 Tax=Acanthoscelides obtectus TaxID=200917 RepID=A0A9P0L0H5_ACAOB|nr:unnamed protein product [Acanthoscelides obtectus]CAK1664612.1 hypothetical protein AOBTE_LOCUS24363 [Acanthoscelides obtectus]
MPHRVQQTYLETKSGTDLRRITKSGLIRMANEAMLDVSKQKREQDRQRLNKLIVQRMREELPVYTIQEIRMHRLPYWEAMMIEMEEKGYKKTIEYINKIFKVEECNDQFILKASKNELEKLFNFLKIHEMYLNQDVCSKACREFLKCGIYFAFLHKDWWWLGERMLLDSIDMCFQYQAKKYEAFSRFSYAKFKIENLKDFSVEDELIVAKEMSATEPWVVKILFPDMKDTLFMQICLLLYRCFMRKARQWVNTHPKEALVLATQAKRNAGSACYKTGEMEASLIKAACEINLNRPREAVATLNCTLTQQTSIKSHEGVCKVKAALVKAHLCNNDVDSAFLTLNDLRDLTKRYNVLMYLAVAYKTLGEYYIEKGEPGIADPFITEALLILEQCDTKEFSADILFMKNLEAIAKGLELMPGFIKHIRQSEEPGPEQELSLSLLIDWKNERKPFWHVSVGEMRRRSSEQSRSMLHDTSMRIKPLDLMDASAKLQNVEKKLAKLMHDQNETPVIEPISKKV